MATTWDDTRKLFIIKVGDLFLEFSFEAAVDFQRIFDAGIMEYAESALQLDLITENEKADNILFPYDADFTYSMEKDASGKVIISINRREDV